jgi:hypothetical protein
MSICYCRPGSLGTDHMRRLFCRGAAAGGYEEKDLREKHAGLQVAYVEGGPHH